MGRYVSPSVTCAALPKRILDVCGGYCCLWTVPSGVSTVTFELWGGGGAGGPKCCCYCQSSSSGAGGGYSLKTISVSPGDTYTICAGAGGSANYCGAGGSQTGCSGCTSYVTGTGLTNLCAAGGGGGVTCAVNYSAMGCVCCGGLACGGDINIPGGKMWGLNFGSSMCAFSVGGASPFGGGLSYFANNHCCPYASCGRSGIYPGGGGTGFAACCCDCCICQGQGAPGLVRVTF